MHFGKTVFDQSRRTFFISPSRPMCTSLAGSLPTEWHCLDYGPSRHTLDTTTQDAKNGQEKHEVGLFSFDFGQNKTFI